MKLEYLEGWLEMSRDPISNNEISVAMEECALELYSTLDTKGYHSYASIHEIAGVLEEEVREFWEEVKANNQEKIREELLDIATVCMFAIACINSSTLDW